MLVITEKCTENLVVLLLMPAAYS